MRVHHTHLDFETRGHGHVLNLSHEVSQWLASIRADDGQMTIFVPGSTAAVTTIEFEPGAVRDLDRALEKIAPHQGSYEHDLRWDDGNGFSHLRAALLGPSLTVPVVGGSPTLGTWQQVVLVECDLAPRSRRVVFSFVGTSEGG
jgi:secondary thiamine-phosphate synthase enzyme